MRSNQESKLMMNSRQGRATSELYSFRLSTQLFLLFQDFVAQYFMLLLLKKVVVSLKF